MVRDDLYATAPMLFRCPISLDVMRSPVSLCTGVTYDRSSIQPWLDSGNNTCPATMQVLSSTDLVPNLTLQHLIDVWSGSLRVDSLGSPQPAAPASFTLLTAEQALSLTRTLTTSTSDALEDSLSKIYRFGRDSEENSRFLAEIDGFACNLLGLLRNSGEAARRSLGAIEMIVSVTEMVLSRMENRHILISPGLKSNLEWLKSLSSLIQRGSLASKIASVKIVELFAVNTETKLAIASNEGLLKQLLSLLSPAAFQALVEASLSCLITLSKPRRVKVTLVALEPVGKLSRLLSSENSTAAVVEKTLKLLEAVSSCTEGRWAMCGGGGQCVELVLQRALKVSSEATERSITILWSLCYLFGDMRAREVLARGNGLTRILMVMQCNCSPAVRQMAGDLVKQLGSNPECRLSGYDTKTTHIMPF
ncbi:hypothetical protein SAY87_006548 [Trapa incisa]|uniref:U-box domain-containing protein n=1 Tax=Trapa incisa TaxID=236973 RepID=A0AAN7PZ08_9MYRT|nr:hypothetical protein SAY87_006548 [Trapa incisa]